MKPEELMLGDIVLASGKPIHVTLATLSCKVDVKPMPLTEEILIKNGFMEVELNDFRLFRDKEYRDKDEVGVFFTKAGLCFWKGDEVSVACRASGCRINRLPAYVHNLQHALKLCGIEKEIIV